MMFKRWYYVDLDLDFLEHQSELMRLNEIIEYLGKKDYEITHFSRYKSEQNKHFNNVSLFAKGRKKLRLKNGEDVIFRWWGGNLEEAINETS